MTHAYPRQISLPLPAADIRRLALMSLFTAYCGGLVAARFLWTGHPSFSFLVWNLFLAWMPVAFSTTANLLHQQTKRFWLALLCLIPWLLFLPNAPYIITDLVHLRPRAHVPYWYDILLISSYAFHGLLLGFYSMTQVHQLLLSRIRPAYGWILMGLVSVGSAYGIYLGRVLRWNSWDILRHPFQILRDCLAPLRHPFANKEAVAMTLILGAFLMLGYLVVYNFQATRNQRG